MKNNVISLADRLERWTEAYVSPQKDMRVSTSNRGGVRFVVQTDDGMTDRKTWSVPVYLQLFESIQLLKILSERISESMEDDPPHKTAS